MPRLRLMNWAEVRDVITVHIGIFADSIQDWTVMNIESWRNFPGMR